MIKRALWIGTTLLLLLVVLAVSWLLMTQKGFQTALYLTHNALPALTINHAQGRLYDGILLQGVSYKPEEGTAVYIDSVDARWQLWSLLSGRLIFNQLHIDRVNIHPGESADEPKTEESFTIPDLSLPIAIHLRSLRITDAKMIDEIGQNTPLFDRFDTSLKINYDRLIISSLRLNREVMAFTLLGDVTLSEPHAANLNYGIRYNHTEWGLISATGTITGDLNQMTVRQQLGEPFASAQTLMVRDLLDKPDWQLNIESETLALERILGQEIGDIDSINLVAQGTLDSAKLELDFSLEEHETVNPSLLASISIISADLKHWRLETDFKINQNSSLDIAGSFIIPQDPFQTEFVINADWSQLHWPWQPDQEQIVEEVDGELSVHGTLQDYRLIMSSSLMALDQSWSIDTYLNGDLNHVDIAAFDVHSALGELSASGEVDWESSLTYQFDGEWHELQVPDTISPVAIESKQGQFQLEGQQDLIALTLDSDFLIDDMPLSMNLLATSPEAGITDIRLENKLANGAAGFTGRINWKENLHAIGKLSLRQIDPSAFAPQWPGQISGQAQLSYLTKDQGDFEAHVNDLHLNGKLRARAFSLDVSLQALNKNISVNTLQLQLGDSQLSVKGSIDDDLELNWRLDSPQLVDFHPSLAGNLKGEGNLSGELSRLKLQADIQGNAIQWADTLSIETLMADARIDLTNNQQSRLNLQFTEMVYANETINSVDLSLNGKRESHQLGLEFKSELLVLSTLLQGEINNENQWSGQLQSMQLSNPLAGDWQLQTSGNLQLSAEKQVISEHCWQSAEQGQVCLQGENTPQQAQAMITINELPVDIVKPFIEEYADLSGWINGKLQLARNEAEDLIGSGLITVDQTVLSLQSSSGNQPDPIDFDTVALRYQLTTEKSRVAVTVAPAVAGVEPIEARLQTAALKEFLAAPSDTPLSVQMQTSVEDLSALNLETLAFDDLSGSLDLNLDVKGTISQPQLTTLVSLREGQIYLVDTGILLTAVNGDIRGDPFSGLNILLQAKSAEGQLEVAGDFTMNQSDWLLEATIKGDKVEVMNLPEAYVVASPDLQLIVSPQNARINGKVTVPTAELVPMDFNTSVSPSSDVVIVGADSEAESIQLATDVDVDVQLGQDVWISAMGFNGRLGGNLRIYGDAGELLLGNGEIIVNEGKYAAYGQNLVIDDGRVRFSGTAIDNPDLDIRAVRSGKDYIAGIHITGPANNPQATLFSEPSMSQENILSYIILGRPLGQANAGDAAILASAATSLGIRNGNAISDKIANTFGLDTVEFTGESPDDAAVQIGKYLSPKLYLGYGIGIFEPVSTVQLRYTLSKIWTLQAESGTHSGVDLLYIYER